jgi:hypothetical protein
MVFTEERIQTILKRLEHEFDDPQCTVQVYVTTQATTPPGPLWEEITEDVPDDLPDVPLAAPSEDTPPPEEAPAKPEEKKEEPPQNKAIIDVRNATDSDTSIFFCPVTN